MKGRMETELGSILIDHGCDRYLCRKCCSRVFWNCRYGNGEHERRSGKTSARKTA